jgi:adenylate cyclase class IV
MHFKELETKYYADNIGMDDFIKLVQPLNPEWIMVSSYDDYFTNDKDEFIRYRYHDHMGELTIKRKTTDANNNNRVEVNVPTDGKSGASIQAFVDLLGYKKNFSIFKTCKIAFLEKAVLVYYVVYDENLNEKKRFIEVEAKESYNWASEEEAWATVVEYETMLAPLGITPKNRLKKSLFELFKKNKLPETGTSGD